MTADMEKQERLLNRMGEELFQAVQGAKEAAAHELDRLFRNLQELVRNPVRVLSAMTDKSPAELSKEWATQTKSVKEDFLAALEEELALLRPKFRDYRRIMGEMTDVLESRDSEEPPAVPAPSPASETTDDDELGPLF